MLWKAHVLTCCSRRLWGRRGSDRPARRNSLKKSHKTRVAFFFLNPFPSSHPASATLFTVVVQSCKSYSRPKPRTPIQKEKKVQNPKQAICVRGGSAWRALQLPEDREPTIDFLLRHVKRPMLNHVASRQMCRRVVWRKQEGTKKRRAWSSGSWENQAHGHGSLWRAPAGWASGDM